ncbi:MAG: hypothetical protein ACBR21_02575 [Microcoleus sp.]
MRHWIYRPIDPVTHFNLRAIAKLLGRIFTLVLLLSLVREASDPVLDR